MFRKMVYLLLGLGLMLSACSPSKVPNDAGPTTKIRLPMGYIPNIQYAPFYAAIEKGYFKQEGIEIEFDYSFETDGVALVGAGELPFALVSGEQVLLARAQGLPVVYAAAWYQQYPISVIAAPDLNIKKPADLKGKTIGLPGLFGATYVGLQALLFEGGLTASDVTLESIGFNQVETFAAGQKKVVVGYEANEPIVLRAKGFEITELRVSDYVQLASNGILTNEKTIAENPELARGFIAAFLKGLQFTIDNPDEALALSKSYIENFESLDQSVQKDILATSIEMWKADRPGYSDPQAWQNMNDVLFNMKLIDKKLEVEKAYTNEFIP